MRLLVITNLFHPDRGGGASVFSDLCFGLAERSWEVTVFTTHPYYPEWRRKSAASPWRIQRETIRGVKVRRFGLYIPGSPSRLLPRLLFESSFGLSLTRGLFGRRFDAMMVFCPMFSEVLFAAARRFLRREPLWLNIQDIPADAAAGTGISRSPLFNRAARWLQEACFNQADVWSTISPVMMERLAGLRRLNQPLHLCPNWLNESMATCLASLPSKTGREPSRPIKLLYAGNIGKKQGLLDFCRSLAASPIQFQLRIHGNGGEAESIRSWIQSLNDSRFSFGEFLDEPGFVRALHETDFFLITERPGSQGSFIPSKLIPSIATGTPLLTVCEESGPLGQEMREAGLGLRIDWDDVATRLPVEFAQLEANPARFTEWQENALKRSRLYSRDTAIPRMAEFIETMVSNRRRANAR